MCLCQWKTRLFEYFQQGKLEDDGIDRTLKENQYAVESKEDNENDTT